MKIVISSYRGGSGKSLFAVTMATSLLGDTLLIEADFLAPSLHYLIEDIESYWNDYLLDRADHENMINNIGGQRIICTKPNDSDLFTHIQNRKIWTTTISDRILAFLDDQTSKRDYIIIDNQAGNFFSSVVHTFFSDIIICLIRPDHGDVMGTVEYLESLNKQFFIVWNQVLDHEEMDDVIEQWTEQYFKGMDYYLGTLGKIPFDEEAAYLRWVKGKLNVYGTEYERRVKKIAEGIKDFKVTHT